MCVRALAGKPPVAPRKVVCKGSGGRVSRRQPAYLHASASRKHGTDFCKPKGWHPAAVPVELEVRKLSEYSQKSSRFSSPRYAQTPLEVLGEKS